MKNIENKIISRNLFLLTKKYIDKLNTLQELFFSEKKLSHESYNEGLKKLQEELQKEVLVHPWAENMKRQEREIIMMLFDCLSREEPSPEN